MAITGHTLSPFLSLSLYPFVWVTPPNSIHQLPLFHYVAFCQSLSIPSSLSLSLLCSVFLSHSVSPLLSLFMFLSCLYPCSLILSDVEESLVLLLLIFRARLLTRVQNKHCSISMEYLDQLQEAADILLTDSEAQISHGDGRLYYRWFNFLYRWIHWTGIF